MEASAMRFALLVAVFAATLAAASAPVDLSGFRAGGPVEAEASANAITVRWSDEQSRPWSAEFSLEPTEALITRIAQGGRAVLEGGRPQYWAETGKRRGGFDEFFDFPPSHPDGTRRWMAEFKAAQARVRSTGNRVEVYFHGLRLGIFSGGVAYTFFPGSRLIQQEAVASTSEPDTAYYYDAGLQWDARSDRGTGNTMRTQIAWYDAGRELRERTLPFFASERQPVESRFRTVAARVPWPRASRAARWRRSPHRTSTSCRATLRPASRTCGRARSAARRRWASGNCPTRTGDSIRG